MGHEHSHGHHHHGVRNTGRAFAIGVALNVVFVVAEAAVGLAIGSLALLADAGHNLSDVLGLILAWGADILGRRAPSPRFTYGLRRATIHAALLNAFLLLLAVGAIAWEAVRRLMTPSLPASAEAVIGVAALGVVVNGMTAALFWHGQKEDLNIRGAFLHMAADAGISLGVVVAGVAIKYTGWEWIDPVTSLLIVVVITIGTWSLLWQSARLVFDAVPEGIDPNAVRKFLEEVPGVVAVHDLHIWAMSTTETALTAHLVRDSIPTDEGWLAATIQQLHDRFGIEHSTIQVEGREFAQKCRIAPDHVV
jgi:cobalt-zinc-cadmium efflux system protein